MDPARILSAAREQFRKELFDDAVKREVELLRRQENRSLWQRLLGKLPFTITWRNK